MSSTTSVTYLKKWLSFMIIYPSYNTKRNNFYTSQLKFILLLIIVLTWGIVRQIVNMVSNELYIGPFLLFGQILVSLIMIDNILLNTSTNTKKLNKLFAYMDKLEENNENKSNKHFINMYSYFDSYKDKNKYGHIKYVCIIWNIAFISALLSMIIMMVTNFRFWLACQCFFELPCMYYMQAGILWRYFLCSIMCSKLACVNETLRDINVKRSYPNGVHQLLNQLIIDHNVIVNWVEVFNDLLGCQTFLMKLYELFHVLVTLDMFLSGYFMNSTTFHYTNLPLIGLTVFIVIQCFLTSTVCERFSDAGMQTISVVNNVIMKCDYNDSELKEKLILFSNQARDRCPKFSAMGVFLVNHSLIFTFINMTVSYVIVIIQMYQTN